MIRSCDTCGVGTFDEETGICAYCAEVAASEAAKDAGSSGDSNDSGSEPTNQSKKRGGKKGAGDSSDAG